MKNLGIEELGELMDCSSALEEVLRRLDVVGAGLAAIHVDAAIHQLRANLDATITTMSGTGDQSRVAAGFVSRIPH
ncbi:hypothetical protein [Qipengyuania nanhaisediminis]|uniref:hypothetical protein n=1 Tax=Qipengyuania nanhaisediminis TaxID=604088 RepID=UPI0038B23DFC